MALPHPPPIPAQVHPQSVGQSHPNRPHPYAIHQAGMSGQPIPVQLVQSYPHAYSAIPSMPSNGRPPPPGQQLSQQQQQQMMAAQRQVPTSSHQAAQLQVQQTMHAQQQQQQFAQHQAAAAAAQQAAAAAAQQHSVTGQPSHLQPQTAQQQIRPPIPPSPHHPSPSPHLAHQGFSGGIHPSQYPHPAQQPSPAMMRQSTPQLAAQQIRPPQQHPGYAQQPQPPQQQQQQPPQQGLQHMQPGQGQPTMNGGVQGGPQHLQSQPPQPGMEQVNGQNGYGMSRGSSGPSVGQRSESSDNL